ncbi:MAG: DUF11 domain-containing protein [Thermoanaerobaculia bacterium]|nr:DUF11 domain-containing protein [Thermoanaerobaculia bacterium]
MRRPTLLVLALSVLLLALPAGAVPTKPDLSGPQSAAALVAGGSPPEAVEALDLWGFEAAEGFAPGFVGSQVGWTATVASSADPVISTANPSSGAQHLRCAGDAAVASGTLIGAFSPDLGPQAAAPSSVCVDVAIGAVGGADYDVIAQAPSQTFLTARVKFYWLGDIQILDDTGSGLAYIDTGVNWTAGPYNQLCIFVDPVADTIDYWYGGALIYSSVAGVFAATQIEQVVLLSDNWQGSEVGDFDNLVINTNAQPADLALTKVSDATGNVNPGDTVVYTLTVNNLGAGDATGVVVTDTLPAGLTYVGNDCSATFAAPTLTWSLGGLANGASAVCNVSVTVDAGAAGTLVNTASVTSDDDPTPANDTATAEITAGTLPSVLEIPTLNGIALAVLALLLLATGALFLRRRRA